MPSSRASLRGLFYAALISENIRKIGFHIRSRCYLSYRYLAPADCDSIIEFGEPGKPTLGLPPLGLAWISRSRKAFACVLSAGVESCASKFDDDRAGAEIGGVTEDVDNACEEMVSAPLLKSVLARMIPITKERCVRSSGLRRLNDGCSFTSALWSAQAFTGLVRDRRFPSSRRLTGCAANLQLA